jgi:hypothetical protein
MDPDSGGSKTYGPESGSPTLISTQARQEKMQSPLFAASQMQKFLVPVMLES